jgi:hypothetical protein
MARDQEKDDSVYDFLYVDRKRIAFYLSQFDDYGHLTQLTRSVSESSETGGGIDLKIAKIEGKEGEQTSLQKHYDTQWVAPLSFLDKAGQRGMIARGLKNAALGKLVLTSGALHIVNMRAFERVWDVVSAAPNAPAPPLGNRQQRRATGNQPPPNPGNTGLKVLGSLEQPVFMVAQADEANLWSTLDPDSLIGGSSDLNLKHGERIAGDWHVVSIVDCYPDSQIPTDHTISRSCGTEGNDFGVQALNIWHELGLVLGRPPQCFGVTPLLIMRVVT